MNKKQKAVLKQSFIAPRPQHGESFINSLSYPKTRLREAVISQILFIRKRIWLAFVLGVFFAFTLTRFLHMPAHIVGGISAILPFFSLCAIGEIYKSASCHMEEMELACKYNLTKIILMRMGILGTVSFVIFLLFALIAGKSNFGLFRNMIYIGVPYLLCCYLSLSILATFGAKEPIYVCATISGATSISMILVSSRYQWIYNINFTFIWTALCIILVSLLGYSLIRFANLQEGIKWSLS